MQLMDAISPEWWPDAGHKHGRRYYDVSCLQVHQSATADLYTAKLCIANAVEYLHHLYCTPYVYCAVAALCWQRCWERALEAPILDGWCSASACTPTAMAGTDAGRLWHHYNIGDALVDEKLRQLIPSLQPLHCTQPMRGPMGSQEVPAPVESSRPFAIVVTNVFQ